MRISLLSPVRKSAFLSGCITAGILAWMLSWQALAEYWVTRNGTVSGFESAAHIQPLNADYPRILGNHLIEHNFDEATAKLEESARINPNSPQIWLSLSRTYGVSGAKDKQYDAIMKALATNPKDVDVEWEASVFLIQNDDIDRGLKLVREVISNDPGKVAPGMQTAFRASGGDIVKTIEAIPPTAAARLNFLHWLIDHEQASAADRVWPSVTAAEGTLRARDLFFYIDSLIGRGQVMQAQTVWASLKSDPEVQHRIEPGNAIVNGDFEDNLLNGGFDWHYAKTDGVTVTMDTSIIHGGTRSLSLQFDADSIPDAGVYQLIPVEASTRYSLRGFMRSEELESANGVRIGVTDYYSYSSMAMGEEIIGSTSWREVSAEFTTGPDTRLLKVGIVRSPSHGRIRGKLWIDDLRMEKRP